jgi:serine protease AprX
VDEVKTELSNQYVFASLDGNTIKALVEIDQREAEKLLKKAEAARLEQARQALGAHAKATLGDLPSGSPLDVAQFRTIHHIWPDFELRSCITSSIRTVKVDAAQRSFAALGAGITWAVMDTGIDGLHPHFRLHGNIDLASPDHADFTGVSGGPQPLKDDFGHGTHVAGIIAGEQSKAAGSDTAQMVAVSHELDSNGKTVSVTTSLEAICGMASKCKLVSLKVLDEFGIGKASNVIAAIAHVQAINGHGRDLKIHGVNLSLGHAFDPKWFACGHSPLCVEVNRLVKSGVVVVVAAGNTGYGTLQTKEGSSDTCLDLTINDPGNAEYAITVGSTHRDMPHMYGVSYFSSKGPTGDGRRKPDLLAPGEKIISCASPNSTLVQREADGAECNYFETSGTSMAAPHVSGAIAAFLSIRREFIGEAEKVKEIFSSTATDLGRDRYFQGAGLVDLMRAIQSV